MMHHAFEKFMRRVLNQPVQVPRCKACGAPGPAICAPCQRFSDYAGEVEQRRSSSQKWRLA
jgi:hypothetical protein